MTHTEIVIVGSGFAGSLLARILRSLGCDVMLIERGTHPRFAIGESTTPLANLSLERIAARYGLRDCHELAAHGRWLEHHPELRRGLKRGFTFLRHHPGQPFTDRGGHERLLVAASPNEHVSDTHWLRADVDHHFVKQAIDGGVDYRDRVELTRCEAGAEGILLHGTRDGEPLTVRAEFVVDASGPGGFLARQFDIPDALDRTHTRSSLLFGHFADVGLLAGTEEWAALPAGPYPDDWAAVHHIIDEGWMYSLRFDDGATSAGFVLRKSEVASTEPDVSAEDRWIALLARYPTVARLFQHATPLMPIRFVPRIQHRLARAAGERWVLLPHAYAFVDPLFSTGIAWALRGVERLALAFEDSRSASPSYDALTRYERLLAAEADQIDRLVAGAYDAMIDFELFVAHALIYFAAVSYAETLQRVAPGEDVPWSGFLGVGDHALHSLSAESHERLRALTDDGTRVPETAGRAAYVRWASAAIAPRNIAGFADARRRNLYPLDVDTLVDRHALLGMTRDQVVAALPRLRGQEEGAVTG